MRPHWLSLPHRPHFDSRGMIHIEHHDRGATGGRAPDNFARREIKMFIPTIPPRVKKRRHLRRPRINPGKVRPLVRIAQMAGQREILRLIATAMLPGDDVFDVKTKP